MGGKDRNGDKKLLPLGDPNWQVVNEYDPLWPNDYMKVVAGTFPYLETEPPIIH